MHVSGSRSVGKTALTFVIAGTLWLNTARAAAPSAPSPVPPHIQQAPNLNGRPCMTVTETGVQVEGYCAYRDAGDGVHMIPYAQYVDPTNGQIVETFTTKPAVMDAAKKRVLEPAVMVRLTSVMDVPPANPPGEAPLPDYAPDGSAEVANVKAFATFKQKQYWSEELELTGKIVIVVGAAAALVGGKYIHTKWKAGKEAAKALGLADKAEILNATRVRALTKRLKAAPRMFTLPATSQIGPKETVSVNGHIPRSLVPAKATRTKVGKYEVVFFGKPESPDQMLTYMVWDDMLLDRRIDISHQLPVDAIPIIIVEPQNVTFVKSNAGEVDAAVVAVTAAARPPEVAVHAHTVKAETTTSTVDINSPMAAHQSGAGSDPTPNSAVQQSWNATGSGAGSGSSGSGSQSTPNSPTNFNNP